MRRFRIFVRKTLYFEREIAELGPAYSDCTFPARDCTRLGSDPWNGCPACKYTVKRKRYNEELEKAIAKGSPGPEADRKWPISQLRDTMNTVARAHYNHKNGHSRKWSVTTALLVDIYRSEIGRMKSIDAWNLSQKHTNSGSASRPAMKPQPRRGQADEDLDDEE